ncbi:Hypothetical protein SMAX5B_000169 [Scophthalmus maximus]|uniref:Uncharacterized protein n=1 Tax=Scophthalmus maximus TaxID=52904 RepID=A0A2U9CX09_SCOMX|nr:Hypothetical protein SMAX5B_000169 [Scophthalmus maximus]KAF0023937.1 hypothetical protein F2P81_024567 [Scophthalmus maximus]
MYVLTEHQLDQDDFCHHGTWGIDDVAPQAQLLCSPLRRSASTPVSIRSRDDVCAASSFCDPPWRMRQGAARHRRRRHRRSRSQRWREEQKWQPFLRQLSTFCSETSSHNTFAADATV